MTRARILVIDDDPLFRSLIAATLRKEYLVSVATDGADGCTKALEHAPDLAVVDMQMPVRDGLAVLKIFRAHPTLRNVPVIMLTGDSSKGSVISAIQHGVNDYVIKTSFNKVEFLQKISRLLTTSQTAVTTEAPRTTEAARPVETPRVAREPHVPEPVPSGPPAAEKQLQSISITGTEEAGQT